MAGSITVSSITLDSDNNFSIKSNTGATILSANGTGLITGIANGASIVSAQLTTPTISSPIVSGNVNLDSTGTTGFNTATANTVRVHTAGVERARVDSSGSVGIGTTSPQAPLDVTYSDGSRNDCLRLTNNNTGGYGPWLNFYGNYNGGYSFAKIGTENDSTGGSLRFHTADTSEVSTERMRIDSSGRVTMPYQPAFYAYISTNGSVSGTFPFNLTQVNIGSSFNTSTYRFTAPVAGTYYFSFGINMNNTGGSFYLRKNGSQIAGSNSNNAAITNWTKLTTDAMVTLAAGDYVDAYCGGATYVYDSISYNFFTGWLIG